MERGHRNMLQQLQYNFILIICASDGVIININNISVFNALHGSALVGHYQVLYDNKQI